jgi:hypothetical protein
MSGTQHAAFLSSRERKAMNSHEIPSRIEGSSQIATKPTIGLSQIATTNTSIVPEETPIAAVPPHIDAIPETEIKRPRWPLIVIVVGLISSLLWSLSLVWLAGFLLEVW